MIESNIRRFHLLWGRSFYKSQFGAVPHDLYESVVFRHKGWGMIWRCLNAVQWLIAVCCSAIGLLRRIGRKIKHIIANLVAKKLQ